MSLQALFEDRKRRDYIRAGINEAVDITEKEICEGCEVEAHLLEAFEMHLCEDCCERVLRIAESYDRELPRVESMDQEFIKGILDEGIVYFDMNKMQAEANKKSGGDIKVFLKKEYNINVGAQYVSADKIDFYNDAHTSGNARMNKLINDFDGEFKGTNWASRQVPDSDGTVAVYKVRGSGVVTGSPASAGTAVAKPSVTSINKSASSSAAVTKVPKTVKTSSCNSRGVTGDTNKFTYASCIGLMFEFTGNSGSGGNLDYDVNVYIESSKPSTSTVFTIQESKAKKTSDILEEFWKEVAKNPGKYFPAFADKEEKFYLPKYKNFYVSVDEKTFTNGGNVISAVFHVRDEDIDPSVDSRGGIDRLNFTAKALKNRSALSKELNESFEDGIRKLCPSMVDGKNKVKTSVGDAVFILNTFGPGCVFFDVDWAGDDIKGQNLIKRTDLSDDRASDKAFHDLLFDHLSTVMPGGENLSKKGSVYFPEYVIKGVPTGSVEIEIYSRFDRERFDHTGDISFVVRIKIAGQDRFIPEMDGDVYFYKKSGVSMDKFLIAAGTEMYKKYAKEGIAPLGGFTPSALNKMGNPSKKVALLRKIAGEFKDYLDNTVVGFTDIADEEYTDYEIELDMEVNVKGEVTKVEFNVIDNGDFMGSPDEFYEALSDITERVPFIKILNSLDSDTEIGCRFRITDIADFSDAVGLSIFESVILEAYGISTGKRKVFVI